jgi:hypothetical protein
MIPACNSTLISSNPFSRINYSLPPLHKREGRKEGRKEGIEFRNRFET